MFDFDNLFDFNKLYVFDKLFDFNKLFDFDKLFEFIKLFDFKDSQKQSCKILRVNVLRRFGGGAYLDFAKSHNMRHRSHLYLYTNFQFLILYNKTLNKSCTNEFYLPNRSHFS